MNEPGKLLLYTSNDGAVKVGFFRARTGPRTTRKARTRKDSLVIFVTLVDSLWSLVLALLMEVITWKGTAQMGL